MTTENRIRVNRKKEPTLPTWALKWLMPEVQKDGPKHIYPGTIATFPDPLDSGRELVKGDELFVHLQTQGLIARCLNFQEGRALVSYIPFRSSPFVGTWTLMWKSVVLGSCGNLFVPYVQNPGGQAPLIYWYWLGYPVHLKIHKGLIEQADTLVEKIRFA